MTINQQLTVQLIIMCWVFMSKVDVEDTRLNLISNSGNAFYAQSSYLNFYTPVVDCTSEYSCFSLEDSSLNIDLSDNYEGPFEVTSNNGSAFFSKQQQQTFEEQQ